MYKSIRGEKALEIYEAFGMVGTYNGAALAEIRDTNGKISISVHAEDSHMSIEIGEEGTTLTHSFYENGRLKKICSTVTPDNGLIVSEAYHSGRALSELIKYESNRTTEYNQGVDITPSNAKDTLGLIAKINEISKKAYEAARIYIETPSQQSTAEQAAIVAAARKLSKKNMN